MPSATALEAADIHRSYEGVHALQGAGLRVDPGQIVGLIGPNGAGKSTLVNIISGYDLPDAGTVTVDGADVTRRSARYRSRNGLARTFQHGQLYPLLSVRENVEVACLGSGASSRSARQLATELLSLVDIGDRQDQRADALPHGIARRLGIARALAVEPRYLLLDEPAAGLNDGEIEDFGEILSQIRSRGIGVLLIDHNVHLIMSVCEWVYVVVEGRSVLDGEPSKIRRSEVLADSYLGRRRHGN